MFHNKKHLLLTTVCNEKKQDIIPITFINHTNWFKHFDTESSTWRNDFDVRKFSPIFLTSDLSGHFGPNGTNNMRRFGDQFRSIAKKKLESSFCAVIMCDNNESINKILFEMCCVLDTSNKSPFVLLITPPDLTVQFIKETENMVIRHVTIDLNKCKHDKHHDKKTKLLKDLLSQKIGELFFQLSQSKTNNMFKC